jgi:hypothetical protein
LSANRNSNCQYIFNNFSFQLFLTNTQEVDPAQPFISLETFLLQIKQDVGQAFVNSYRSKAQSLRKLFSFFNLGNNEEIDPNDEVPLFNTLNGQDFLSFPICHSFRRLGTAAESDLSGTELQLAILLKLFFSFKIHVTEFEAKHYLLRDDYESKKNQLLADWLNNLGVGAVSQLKGDRKITFGSFG